MLVYSDDSFYLEMVNRKIKNFLNIVSSNRKHLVGMQDNNNVKQFEIDDLSRMRG